MGTPVPLFLPGDLCTHCWGYQKPYEALFTNKFIGVEISGVGKGPDWTEADGEPINGDFTVTQSKVLPCEFYLLYSVPLIYLYFDTDRTQLVAKNEKNVEYFQTFSAGACPDEISNDLQFYFTGGTAKLWIPGYNV